MLITILTLFIAGSAQSISADHLKSDGKGVFTDQINVNLVSEKDSKYKIHLQVVVRDAQGQLISVLESSGGQYLQHELTDYLFDQRLGEKEIITVDGVKYEKVQFTDTFPGIEYLGQAGVGGLWLVQVCGELINEHIGIDCAHIFEVRTNQVTLEDGDAVKTKWTVLRIMN